MQPGGAGNFCPLGRAALHGGGVGLKRPAGSVEGIDHKAADDVVLQTSGGGDNQLIRAVIAAVVRPHGVAGYGADGSGGAADGPAQRVGAQHGSHKVFMRYVRGVIAVHGDFLQDDVALLLHFGRIQDGTGDHVGDDVDGHGQVRVQHAREVAGALLGRGCVGLPADLVERRGDFQGGPPLGSLEQEVLQEVSGAVLARGFIARPDAHPETDCRRALARHRFGEHPHAARQH